MVCFSILFSLLILLMNKGDLNSYNEYFIFLYGYLDLWNIENIFSLLFWLMPQLFLLSIYGNFIENNLLSNSSIIFTRTNKKEKCMLCYLAYLLGQVIVFNIVMNISHLIIYYIFFHSVPINLETFQYAITVLLWESMILVLANILSLIMKSSVAFLSVIILQCIMISFVSICIVNKLRIIRYIPISCILFCLSKAGVPWHFSPAIRYLLLLAIIESICGLILLKYHEFINERKV